MNHCAVLSLTLSNISLTQACTSIKNERNAVFFYLQFVYYNKRFHEELKTNTTLYIIDIKESSRSNNKSDDKLLHAG